MNKSAALVGVLALAILSACSQKAPLEKQAGATAATSDDDDAAPPLVKAPAQPAPAEKVNRPQMAAEMLALLDTSSKCQSFRAQMAEAGKAPANVPTQDMVNIFVKANEAGCTKKTERQP